MTESNEKKAVAPREPHLTGEVLDRPEPDSNPERCSAQIHEGCR